MPSWTIIFLPPLILCNAHRNSGLWPVVSPRCTVFYRDFRHIVPFLTQIFMFTTPVILPKEYAYPGDQWILAFNPMFGIVNRDWWAILGLHWNFLVLARSPLHRPWGLFVFALFYFRKTERRFADFA